MEYCPLNSMPHDPPAFCMESCELLWDQAISNRVYDGDYDWYANPSHDDSVARDERYDEPCRDTTVEYSHSGLSATSEHERSYTIVDACGEGHELGEQGYKFTCPHPLEPSFVASLIDLEEHGE